MIKEIIIAEDLGRALRVLSENEMKDIQSTFEKNMITLKKLTGSKTKISTITTK